MAYFWGKGGGSLDTSFDGDGKATTSSGGGSNLNLALTAVQQPDGKVVVAGQGSGNFALARYYAAGSRMEQRVYALADANFNITAVTESGGQVAQRFSYDPYGTASSIVTNRDTGWIYLHQGGRYSTLSGTYHFRNRDYSPSLGRWIEQDPMGYVDGVNTQQYERGNPLAYQDPTGLAVKIGFFGADVLDPNRFPNGNDKPAGYEDGNKAMRTIGRIVDAKMFWSNSVLSAAGWLLDTLDTNLDGVYDPYCGDLYEDIRIFGHSWGGFSAIMLARLIKKDDRFVEDAIDIVYAIDPVNTLRGSYPEVPDNVGLFVNRYQTGNSDVRIAWLIAPHGNKVPSQAASSIQTDLNPPPGTNRFRHPSVPFAITIDHWSIVAHVKDEVVRRIR